MGNSGNRLTNAEKYQILIRYMRFRDRPLLPDGIDASVYLARPRLEEAISAPLRMGRNVLVLGDAGAGKSTLLRRVAALLDRSDRPAVVVNGAMARDAGELLELVGAALDERFPQEGDSGHLERRSSVVGLVEAVRHLARPAPVAILVDDPGEAAYEVFGRLRDELWAVGHVWLVAARPRDSAPLRTPPADAFWGRVVEIPPLSYAETEGLLRRGLTDEEYQRVDVERPLSGAHPRYVIRWAQDALEPEDAEAGPPLGWHLRQASGLGRSESMAVAELQGIGRPVSAHDPELLERLGWSRPYAQRVLANLEEHGLLRSIPERSDKPGRPRKLYELDPHPTAA